MKCPYCNSDKLKVMISRNVESDCAIRRRRVCLDCQKKFTTYETIKELDLLIVKNDGRREPFDREKLKNGITKACGKRPISADKIEEILRNVETKLREVKEKELTSSVIGELVMDELKLVDHIAYVRFASVYRKFKDVNELLEEIKKL